MKAMNKGSATRRAGGQGGFLDGWLWPRQLPPPASFREVRAGDLRVRYPNPSPGFAASLVSSLGKAGRRLSARRIDDVIAVLGSVGEAFPLDMDDNDFREISANAGLSMAMTRTVVNGMARSWTRDALAGLVRAEFPEPRVLDGFVAGGGGGGGGRRVAASGRGLTFHIGAGSVPGVTVMSMIRALLVKSAVLAKPGAGDVALAVRFARALRGVDSSMGEAVAVQYWPGGSPEWDAWERSVLGRVDRAVVYGSNTTIESVRARAPASTRLVEHPHRLGVAVVGPESPSASARPAAEAVALFDQKGCVSTHIFFFLGGKRRALRWCQKLANRLAELDRDLPPTEPQPGDLSDLHQFRGRLTMKGAASGGLEVWSSDGFGWTVVLASLEDVTPVGGRLAWVVPVASQEACLDALASLSPALQTVGLAGLPPVGEGFVRALFGLGASRVVPLTRVPFPGADWLHDGSRPLGELVRWCEVL